MTRERYGELERLRDELAAVNSLNEQLENRIAVLENKLRIAEAEGRAAQLQVEAHKVLDRVPLPTETHPIMEHKGKARPASVYALGIPASFELALGVPKGLMLGKFLKGPVEDAIKKHYPRMRRSAARAILIDEVCGKAVTEIPIWARQRTNLMLDMLDTFETMLVDKQQAEAQQGGRK